MSTELMTPLRLDVTYAHGALLVVDAAATGEVTDEDVAPYAGW